MADAGNLQRGIFGNQQFIDRLYRYGKINSEVVQKRKEEAATVDTEMGKKLTSSALHRIESVNICLVEIKSKTPEWETYFNYLRWNRKTISDELDFYLKQQSMEDHRGTLVICHQNMNSVMDEYMNFTPAENAIISEYQQAYNIILSPRRQPLIVLRQAGKLFVNFINILTRRYYYEEADIKFADIDHQARVLIRMLSSEFHQQADTVKKVHESFVQLREMQDCDRSIQKESLKIALKLAHARAAESIFQSAKRYMLDLIANIHERLKTSIRVGATLIEPILHPVNTVKNLVKTLTDPVRSVEALSTWASQNRLKCLAIVAGGVVIGAITLGGSALLIDLYVIDFAATTIQLFAFGGGVVGAIVPLCVAANQARELIESAENEEKKLLKVLSTYESNFYAQGENIAAQALNAEYLNSWTLPNKTGNFDQQIATMNEENLRQMESQLNENLLAIEGKRKDEQTAVEVAIVSLASNEDESLVLYRAAEILRRRIEAAATGEATGDGGNDDDCSN